MARDRIIILAIDDIEDNLLALQAVISETFKEAIFFTALSGTKGIELARSINPDVILLDVVMPGMDGYQVCEILKKDNTLKEIPVVFVTANKDDKKSRVRALNLGAEGFLSKPIDESELTAQIRAMHKVRRANLQKMDKSKRLEALVADKTKELNATIAVLKHERDLAQNYLNIAGAMIVIVDLNENVSLINKKGCSIIGTDEKDIIGKNWFDNYTPEDSRNERRNDFNESCTNGDGFIDKYKKKLLTASGEERLISWEISTLCDNEENIIGILGSGKDITEIQAATDKLKHEKELAQKYLNDLALAGNIFENSITNAPVPVMAHAEDGSILNVSQTFTELTNYTKADIPTVFDWTKKAYGKDKDEVLGFIRKLYMSPEIQHNGEFVVTTKDGRKLIWEFNSGVVGKLSDGRAIAISIAKDVTEMKNKQLSLLESFDRLDRSQKISSVGSWELDLDTNLVWGSQEAFNIYGLPRDSEYISLPITQEMIISEDRELMNKALANLIENGDTYNVYFTVNTGIEKKHLHSKATISKNSLGKPSKVLGVIRDITEFKKKEEELILAGNIFENSITNAPVPIMIHTEDGTILNISRTITKLTNYTKADIPTIYDWTKKAYGKDKDEVIDFIKKLYVSPEIQHNGEATVTTKDGRKLIWDFNSGVVGKLPDGRAVAMSVAKDVTELKQKEDELVYTSYHDSLTGLYNRRYYEENLGRLDIPENYPLTVLVADINGLKLINDAFGHSAGDELLISAANLISNFCRETDLVARTGGDEFIIIMPNTSGIEAEKVINKINEEAKKLTIESIELSISFGFETKNEINEDIQEIYRSAEDLMYRVKLIEIPSMRSGAIETILNTLYEKEKNSEIHSRTVSNISEKIAVAYGMNSLEVAEVKTAGLLHDIGKIIIPVSVILKEGKLTEEEYELIKGHPEIGFRILNSTHDMRNISNIVLSHHERWDGRGYPRGIKADEIPLQSRIISIADAFDAMTSKRTYREVYTNKQALNEIIVNSGTQFDPELAQVFIDNFEKIIEIK